MKRWSLTARVLLFASVWAVIALVVIAIVISQLYRAGSERAFGDLLRAHLNSVINAVSIDANGHLTGNLQLGDLVFEQPGSGWIWLVEPLGDLEGPRLASVSLGEATIAVPPVAELPFNQRYQRSYPARDGQNNPLEVVETEVELDSQGRAARFRVAGNRQVLEAEIAAFSGNLYLALALFGIGSLVVNAIAILVGLRPLDHARKALGRIRAGEARQLDGVFPREIAPLAGEINELIDANHRVVERAGAFAEDTDRRPHQRIARYDAGACEPGPRPGRNHAGAGPDLSGPGPHRRAARQRAGPDGGSTRDRAAGQGDGQTESGSGFFH